MDEGMPTGQGWPLSRRLLGYPDGWREFIRALWRSQFLTSTGCMELESEQNPI